MNSQNNFDNFLKRMGNTLNIPAQNLENAAKNGKLGEVLKGIDKKKLGQIEKVLKNREQTEKILNSPQAQEIMKRLNGEKGR